jgi:hypothetical protein
LALAVAIALGGCTNLDTSQGWFAKPLDVTGRSAGYSFSELSESQKNQHPITPNDLVNAGGSCPAPGPVAAAGTPSGAPPETPLAAPLGAAAGDSSLLGGGVALGMSECDVVSRAGQPSSVQIGSAPNGDRTAVLTFQSGPRPGIYRFLRGSLTEMNRGADQAPSPQVAKKKPTKPQKKAASN